MSSVKALVAANDEPATENAPAVFVLVHGTFASDAVWVRDDSKLSRALVQEFGPKITLDSFRWSGHNSHAARVAGGCQFESRLRSLAKAYPNRPLFVVGHSHGGNVAMYAIRDSEIAGCVSGIVTLGTPFIVAERRAVKRTAKFLWTNLMPFTLVAVLGTSIFGLTQLVHPSAILIAVIPFIILFYSGQLNKLIRWFRGAFPTAYIARLAARQRAAFQPLRNIVPTNPPAVLRISVAGDEADLLLRASWLTAEFPHLLWKATSSAFSVICVGLGVLFFGTLLLLFAYPLAALVGHEDAVLDLINSAVATVGDFLGATFGSAGLVVLCVVLLPCVISLLGVFAQLTMIVIPYFVRRIAFGPESVAQFWLLNIRPNRDPPKVASDNVHFRFPRGFDLVHCKFYEDDQVVACLCHWVRERMADMPNNKQMRVRLRDGVELRADC